MTDVTKRSGGCHCGAVRYEVETDLAQVMSCNCSICSKKGILWNFVPIEKFTLLSGEENLADYLFNKHVVHHLSCKTCGVESFARGQHPNGTYVAAINVRCLDGIELSELKLTPVDGRSR
jgi:hypothetical protein